MLELHLWMAYALTVIIFAVLLVLAWSVPKASILSDAPDTSAWRDLRVWASALIVLELLIYYVFS